MSDKSSSVDSAFNYFVNLNYTDEFQNERHTRKFKTKYTKKWKYISNYNLL